MNDAPVANHVALLTTEDVAIEFDLCELANDVDNSFDELTVSFLDSWLGNVKLLEDGLHARFTPHSDFNGGEDLWFSVTDAAGLEDWNYVDLVVEAVNDAPVVTSANLTTMEDDPLWIDLGDLVSDKETPLEQLSIRLHDVRGGTIERLDAYSILFTPDKDHAGRATFLLTANDQDEPANNVTGEIQIEVTAVNDAPVTFDLALSTTEAAPVEFNLRDIAYDAETSVEQLTFEFHASDATTIEMLPGGYARVIPHPDFVGEIDLWFSVTDPQGSDAWGCILLEVTHASSAQIAFIGLSSSPTIAAVQTEPANIGQLTLEDDPCSAADGASPANDDCVPLPTNGDTEASNRSQADSLFRDEEEWADIALGFDSVCAADSIFAELGACD